MQFSNNAGKKIRNEKMHKDDKDLEYFTSFHFHVWLQNKSCSIFAMNMFSSEITKNNISSLIIYNDKTINDTYMSKKAEFFRIPHAFVLNTFIYPKGYELLLINS